MNEAENGSSNAETARLEPAFKHTNVDAMKCHVRRTASEGARHDFHAPSRTHVVWCLEVGRGGAKGVGELAEEARLRFNAQLEELISKATVGDLERWSIRLGEDSEARRREEHIRSLAAGRRMGEYSISLDPSQTERFRVVAPSGTLNDVIVGALRAGLVTVRDEARGKTLGGMRQAILGQDASMKAARREGSIELDVRTLRMDAEVHARLRLEAHELGVKLPELCRYVVEVWFKTSTSSPEHLGSTLDRASVSRARRRNGTPKVPRHGAASGILSADPFNSLSPPEFEAVARSTGVNTMLLSRIRDGHIDPTTIPAVLAERVRVALPEPLPAADWTAFLHKGPRLPAIAMFKSGRKPKAAGLISFADAVKSSGLPDGAQAELLALSDQAGPE